VAPSVDGTTTLPGDTFVIEALQPDGLGGSAWTSFGEGLKVEETGTIAPQFAVVDETFLPWFSGGSWAPAQFRVTYKPVSRSKDASGVAIPAPTVMNTGATPTFTVKKVTKVKTTVFAPKKVTHGGRFYVAGQAAPVVGIGWLKITISKKGFKTLTYKLLTDDSSYAQQQIRLTKRGTYKVSAAWLGTSFGSPSKAYSKNVVVR
jgi:hypothetical protein